MLINITRLPITKYKQKNIYLRLWGWKVLLAGVFSSLKGWVDSSDTLGNLDTLPLLLLAFGPISSIMYFHPSIGLLRLNMWVFIKLAIWIPQIKPFQLKIKIKKWRDVSVNNVNLVNEIKKNNNIHQEIEQNPSPANSDVPISKYSTHYAKNFMKEIGMGGISYLTICYR